MPRMIFIDAESVEILENEDCLSKQATIFRNGGMVDGKDAIPFYSDALVDVVRHAIWNYCDRYCERIAEPKNCPPEHDCPLRTWRKVTK